jgi:hypothetical protein
MRSPDSSPGRPETGLGVAFAILVSLLIWGGIVWALVALL